MSKGELTRTKILDEAVPLASRLGFEGLTLGVLATSLGLSKSGLYAHFRSKEALVLAVFERTLQRYADHVGPYLEGLPSGLTKLRAYLRAWLDWVSHSELPAGCPILGASFEFEAVEGPARDRLVAIHRLSRHRLFELIREAIQSGELRVETPIEQVEFQIRAIAIGFHYALRFMRDPLARAHADASVEELFARYRATSR